MEEHTLEIVGVASLRIGEFKQNYKACSIKFLTFNYCVCMIFVYIKE